MSVQLCTVHTALIYHNTGRPARSPPLPRALCRKIAGHPAAAGETGRTLMPSVTRDTAVVTCRHSRHVTSYVMFDVTSNVMFASEVTFAFDVPFTFDVTFHVTSYVSVLFPVGFSGLSAVRSWWALFTFSSVS